MIRKLKSGQYRLYSRKKDPKTNKRRNLGTFSSLAAAQKHEREYSILSDTNPDGYQVKRCVCGTVDICCILPWLYS
jgi:hypothetical protein